MLALRGHSYTGSLESRDCSQPVSEVAAVRVDSSTAVRKPPVMTAADCCASDPARVTIQKTVCIFEATGADRRRCLCPDTNIDPTSRARFRIQIYLRSGQCPLTERPQPGESSLPTTTAGRRTSGLTDCTAVIRRYRPRYQGITNLHCCLQSGVRQTRRRDRAYRRIPAVRGSVRHQFHGGVGQVCGYARRSRETSSPSLRPRVTWRGHPHQGKLRCIRTPPCRVRLQDQPNF